MMHSAVGALCLLPLYCQSSKCDDGATEFARFPTASAISKLSSNASKVEQFTAAVSAIRSHENALRQRWMRDEDGWRKLPARAWPEYQPAPSEIPRLREVVKSKCTGSVNVECNKAKFDLATAFVFNHLDSSEGIDLYKSLAEEEYPDGLTALGVCYLEGLGVSSDAALGVKWLERALKHHSLQAHYEMGGLYYYGAASPFIEENDELAFQYFEYTSKQSHTSGLFMTADMLLAGQGCERDAGRAVELLYQAGERGHRLARATLFRILREEKRIIDELVAAKSTKHSGDVAV